LEQEVHHGAARQPIAALSSTGVEAEYQSTTMTTQESAWLKQLMEDLRQ
jgi:hypothetical protein